MTYRLVVSGDSAGTRIIDEDSGEDVTTRLGAASISVQINPGECPFLRIEAIVRVNINGISDAAWYAKDPRTGKANKLSSLVFADGFIADLSGSLQQVLCRKNAQQAQLD